MTAAGVMAAVWIVALAGYVAAQRAKPSPEKVSQMMTGVDWSKLSEAERRAMISRLAGQLNGLDRDQRRDLRMGEGMRRWFEGLNDAEKEQFIEETMPTGFKQMIGAFEELPPEKRRKALDDSLKRIREASAESRDPGAAFLGQNSDEAQRAEPVSPELRQKIMEVGLSTFYRESSASTKAEVMPVLEELQRAMQSGRYLR
jgi:hypothetical protein